MKGNEYHTLCSYRLNSSVKKATQNYVQPDWANKHGGGVNCESDGGSRCPWVTGHRNQNGSLGFTRRYGGYTALNDEHAETRRGAIIHEKNKLWRNERRQKTASGRVRSVTVKLARERMTCVNCWCHGGWPRQSARVYERSNWRSDRVKRAMCFKLKQTRCNNMYFRPIQ